MTRSPPRGQARQRHRRGPPGDAWNVTLLVTPAIVGLLAVLAVSCCQANAVHPLAVRCWLRPAGWAAWRGGGTAGHDSDGYRE